MADNVRAVIFNSKKQFLIVTEVDDSDNWKLPGGKLSPSEDPVAGIVRELDEELNLDLSNLSTNDLPFARLITDDGLSSRYIFKVETNEDEINPNSTEIAKLKWCDLGSVPNCENKNHILSAVNSISEL